MMNYRCGSSYKLIDLPGALFNFMRSESRDKDIQNLDEMVAKNFNFYIIDSSREYVMEMPRVVARFAVVYH